MFYKELRLDYQSQFSNRGGNDGPLLKPNYSLLKPSLLGGK